MKTKIFILNILILLFATSCEQEETENAVIKEPVTEDTDPPAILPEGYFEVRFSPASMDMITKNAISGLDTRVQHIRYIIYKSTGEYVKEKVVLLPSQGTPTWPLAVVKDTLPKGSYKAVFLGNVEKTLFPYATSSNPTNYAEVLTNYNVKYSDARIVLPASQYSDNTEYYWANVNFSDAAPKPNVLLQRIIGGLKLHRNTIDAQTALNALVANIVKQINYKTIIQDLLKGVGGQSGILQAILGPILGPVGGILGPVLDPVLAAILVPVTNAVYDLLLKELVNQIGLALTGNANQTGALAGIGVLLNPWSDLAANTTVVSINNFPKTTDFDLNVKDVYTGLHNFRYDFAPGTLTTQRYIVIKGFNADYDIRKINILKAGLVSGVVVEGAVDGFLLPGSLLDVNEQLLAVGDKRNFRYQADYSVLDLGLKSYDQHATGSKPLTISIRLGSIDGLQSVITGIPIIGPALGSTIFGLINNVTISVPLNIPVLGAENLTIGGAWSTVAKY